MIEEKQNIGLSWNNNYVYLVSLKENETDSLEYNYLNDFPPLNDTCLIKTSSGFYYPSFGEFIFISTSQFITQRHVFSSASLRNKWQQDFYTNFDYSKKEKLFGFGDEEVLNWIYPSKDGKLHMTRIINYIVSPLCQTFILENDSNDPFLDVKFTF